MSWVRDKFPALADDAGLQDRKVMLRMPVGFARKLAQYIEKNYQAGLAPGLATIMRDLAEASIDRHEVVFTPPRRKPPNEREQDRRDYSDW